VTKVECYRMVLVCVVDCAQFIGSVLISNFKLCEYSKLSFSSFIGGEHITELLCQLLELQSDSDTAGFKKLSDLRRMQIARQLKEDYAFVAPNFIASSELYEKPSLVAVRRLLSRPPHSGYDSPSVDHHNNLSANADRPGEFDAESATEEIQCLEELVLSDGSVVSVSLDCERFYCAEVLFCPSSLSSCKSAAGLVDLVREVIESVEESERSVVCKTLLVTGRTSLLSGLGTRLHSELAQVLESLGVLTSMNILIGEEADYSVPSAAWKGASKLYAETNSDGNDFDDVAKHALHQNVVTCEDFMGDGTSGLVVESFLDL